MNFRSIKEQVLSVAILSAVAALQPVAWILAQKSVLDAILAGHGLTLTWVLGLALLVVVGIFIRWAATSLTEGRLIHLRRERSDSLMRSALLAGAKRGQETRAAEDEFSLVENLTDRWDRPRIALIRESILTVGTYLAAGWIHPLVPLVGSVLLGVNVLTVRWLSNAQARLVDQDRKSTASFASSYRRLVEAGSSLRTLGRRHTSDLLFLKSHEPFILHKQRAMVNHAKLAFIGQTMYAVEKLLLVMLAVILFMTKHISPGGLIVSVFLIPMMSGCLIRLNESATALYSAHDLLVAYGERVSSNPPATAGRVYPGKWGWRVDISELALPAGSVLARGITLDLKRGELTLLTGPNGIGKSCLLDELFTCLREAGVDVKYVDQDAVLAEGNLADALSWGAPPEQVRNHSSLRLIPESVLNRRSVAGGSISAGERETLLLVRNLLAEPDVLLLDEAMRHLDPISRARVLQELRQMNRAAVVVVAHDIPSEDLRYFDQVLSMSPDGIQRVS